MEKLVYILGTPASTDGASLRTALIEKAVPKLRAAGANQISVNVSDEHVVQGSAVAISRRDPPIRAAVSFWMENADDRAPCEAALDLEIESLAGYLVAEARPLRYDRPVGERTPGVNLVTCINKKPDITDECFFDRWNNEHKTVALEIQSTFSYIRNAVLRKLIPDSPDCHGIVEESFPIEALSDPKVWYACETDEELQARVSRMLDSVRSFLDLSVINSIPMSEYYLG